MNLKSILIGLLVLIVLALGLGTAYYAGVGPAPGGTDAGEQLTAFPTATPTATDTGDRVAETATTPPFSFTIDAVEECGLTCRDVTAILHNNQDEPATGVTVFTRVFAGQDNTDTADLVWEGKQEVGTLEAGDSQTATRRVELSLREAQQVEQQNGWITIVTTFQTDERTVTFKSSEQVT